ncbi:hypothetical protein Bca4012_050319 [Brassica carinata]|uniref:NmrA-like domain-containing protein n=1 Tax=Brassica carinata TaxID=52824 RepID=A0A8X7R895_BRACI|nr:hypothetical protein Bca52824_053028 [Brassica carinata]
MQILDQTKIISTIKEAGNIKRFLPSEFGVNVDRTSAVEPGKSTFAKEDSDQESHRSRKTVINKEEDIAAYTIKTVDDPKSLNKIIYIKTSQEQSVNERNGRLVGEKESPVPMNVILSINHSVFVKGDQTNFTIEASFGLEAFVLYLDVMYTCIDEYLSHFA